MNSKWMKRFKLGALTLTLAAAAAIAGAVAFGGSVYAQAAGPAQGAPAAQVGPRGYGMGAGMGLMAQGRLGGPDNSLVAVSAQVLGMSQTDLVAALNGGKTIAGVAQEKGVAPDKIVDAFVAPRAQALQSAVSAGRLTQAQADANLAAMRTNITARLSAAFTPRGYGPGTGSPGTGFVDSNGDGVCDNLGTGLGVGTQAGPRGPMNRGGRWGR